MIRNQVPLACWPSFGSPAFLMSGQGEAILDQCCPRSSGSLLETPSIPAETCILSPKPALSKSGSPCLLSRYLVFRLTFGRFWKSDLGQACNEDGGVQHPAKQRIKAPKCTFLIVSSSNRNRRRSPFHRFLIHAPSQSSGLFFKALSFSVEPVFSFSAPNFSLRDQLPLACFPPCLNRNSIYKCGSANGGERLRALRVQRRKGRSNAASGSSGKTGLGSRWRWRCRAWA